MATEDPDLARTGNIKIYNFSPDGLAKKSQR